MKNLLNEFRKTHGKLENFTREENMQNDSIWEGIRELYNSTATSEKLLGTLLNGIITSKKSKFLLSKEILQEMMVLDPNQKRKTLNGNEYKAFLKRIIDRNILTCHKKSTPFGTNISEGKRQAGTYQVIHKDIISKIQFIDSDVSDFSPISTPKPTPEYEHATAYEPGSEYAVDNGTESDLQTPNKDKIQVIQNNGTITKENSSFLSQENCFSNETEMLQILEGQIKSREMLVMLGNNNAKEELLALKIKKEQLTKKVN